jgi:para-aminobenzoate synthetase component 1
MEIIEELEPVRRGPYTGSMGWIDSSGNMEFNILIRTLVACGEVGWVQAGAGIVIDSVPDKEYTESLNKAKALWKAILLTEEHVYDPRDR